MEKRSHEISKVLEPLMIPGDIVLIVGADDSRTTLYAKDLREAYAEGQFTAKHNFPALMLGFKVLTELLEFHLRLVLPKEEWKKKLNEIDPQIEKFMAAKASGTLYPENTFRVLCGLHTEFMIGLEGHLAACMPTEFRRMVENLKNEPSRRLWKPGDPGDPTKKPS
jgi:hypothetical protein